MSGRIIYQDFSDFYTALNSMARFDQNIILNLSESGLRYSHLSDDKTVMGFINIPKEDFSLYEISNPFSIILSSDNIKKILSKIKSKGQVEISVTEDKLELRVQDAKTKMRNRIRLNGDIGKPKSSLELKITPTFTFSIRTKLMKIIIEDSLTAGTEVNISCKEDAVEIRADEMNKHYVSILKKDKPLDNITIERPGASKFAGEILKQTINTLSSFDKINVSGGDNLPIKLEAELGSGNIGFWIAPRL